MPVQASDSLISQLPGSNHRVIGVWLSPDRKHSVVLVSFWNDYVQVVAIFLDGKLLDWRETISEVIFSPDSSQMAFVIRDINDPILEETPDSEPDHWHVALIEDMSNLQKRTEFGPYCEEAPEISFTGQELIISFPTKE